MRKELIDEKQIDDNGGRRGVGGDGAEREAHQEKMLETLPFLRKIYNAETGNKLMTFHLEDATAEVVNFMPPGEKHTL